MSADKSTPTPEANSDNEPGGTKSSPRKPYHPPRLTIYGSIQKLTNTTTRGTKQDGGKITMHKRTCL